MKELQRLKPDVAFNALHGKWGEDGCCAAILETLQIPYTHSGVLASSLAMHKEKSKVVFRAAGVPVAESMLVPLEDVAAGHPMKPPYVVKPVAEGSSVGVHIILEGSNAPARAVLDELKRLGVAEEAEDGRVSLLAGSFAPRQGFEEMSWLFADHAHDHLAAAARNLQGDANLLEQSVHVDEITEASAAELQKAAVAAWKQLRPGYLALAQRRFDGDAASHPPAERNHRARFGVYVYIERDKES